MKVVGFLGTELIDNGVTIYAKSMHPTSINKQFVDTLTVTVRMLPRLLYGFHHLSGLCSFQCL